MVPQNSDGSTTNIQEHKVNAFISAVTRARWFLLATILVSALLGAHAYSATNRCEAQQLTMAVMLAASKMQPRPSGANGELSLKTKQAHILEAAIEEVQKKLDTAAVASPQNRELLVAEASDILTLSKAINTLHNTKSEQRALWQLPLSVPEGDFVPLMGITLTVLYTCMWLSARALVEALSGCKDEGLLDIARLYLLFPAVWWKPPDNFKVWLLGLLSPSKLIAKFIEVISLAIPPLVFWFAIRPEADPWSDVPVRHALLRGLYNALVVLAIAGIYQSSRMDWLLSSSPPSSGADQRSWLWRFAGRPQCPRVPEPGPPAERQQTAE